FGIGDELGDRLHRYRGIHLYEKGLAMNARDRRDVADQIEIELVVFGNRRDVRQPGKIAQTGFETPLRPSREKVGVVNGFGCFPEKVSSAKNTGSFIPDDFEHEIGTN